MNRLLIYQNRHISSEINNLKNNDYILVMNELNKMLWIHYLKNTDKKINFIELNDLIEGNINMKFDYIVGNPPYKGTAELHQKTFNKSTDILKIGGRLTFIQPATPVQNKKENPKKNMKVMQDILCKYKTNIKIVPGSIFEEAQIATDLMIINITKEESDFHGIDRIEYKNGIIYDKVRLEDISMTQIPPQIFANIVQKYRNLCDKNGSLHDILYLDRPDAPKDCIAITKIRGNLKDSSMKTFYTFYGKEAKQELNSTFVLKCDKGNEDNMYKYLDSTVARLGLGLLKSTLNVHRGELRLVPQIDFLSSYTDKELYNMIGLTAEEIIELEGVIYNGK